MPNENQEATNNEQAVSKAEREKKAERKLSSEFAADFETAIKSYRQSQQKSENLDKNEQ